MSKVHLVIRPRSSGKTIAELESAYREYLKEQLLKDLKFYEDKLINEKIEFMRHYYQGHIDYISQLSAQLKLGVIDEI